MSHSVKSDALAKLSLNVKFEIFFTFLTFFIKILPLILQMLSTKYKRYNVQKHQHTYIIYRHIYFLKTSLNIKTVFCSLDLADLSSSFGFRLRYFLPRDIFVVEPCTSLQLLQLRHWGIMMQLMQNIPYGPSASPGEGEGSQADWWQWGGGRSKNLIFAVTSFLKGPLTAPITLVISQGMAWKHDEKIGRDSVIRQKLRHEGVII